MRRFLVTMTIETDIEDEEELEAKLRDVLYKLAPEPYLDWFDLELEPED